MTGSSRTVRGLVVGLALAAATAGIAGCGSTAKTHPAAPTKQNQPTPAPTSAAATSKAPSGGGGAF